MNQYSRKKSLFFNGFFIFSHFTIECNSGYCAIIYVSFYLEVSVMRLSITGSKNSPSYYVLESTFVHGKHSTRIVEKLGNYETLKKTHDDPEAWARAYVEELNKKQKEERAANTNNSTVQLTLNANKIITKDARNHFNGGYLFLQDIFYDLGLNTICDVIAAKTKIEYDLTEIFSRLIYSRILAPGSKLKSLEYSDRLIEKSSFKKDDMYRALTLLSQNMDFIQSELYKNSNRCIKRNSSILYYDCTNYFFEIEQEDNFRKYGPSKEHKPNPIVEMGLFMDEDGIPIAFSLHPGNTNEQLTLTPLEKTIEEKFNHSKFVVCTDSGLFSKVNRVFNSSEDKAYVTTQSIKKLGKDTKAWALDPDGWKIIGSDDGKTYNLLDLEKEEHLDKNGKSVFYDKTFYKSKGNTDEVEIIGKDNNKEKAYINEKLIITFSLKYRDYLRYIRHGQIDRAKRLIEACTNSDGVAKSKKKKYRQNDYSRFVESTVVNGNTGEIMEEIVYTLKQDLINQEEIFDGFYGVASNLDESVDTIIGINKKRWQIEECFRIMKTDFSARPVFLSREDRISAHFLTCFVALVVYRYLEMRLSSNEKHYTVEEIVSQLKVMNFLVSSGNGYIPTYARTDFTDRLHQVFGFRTDYEIIPVKDMKKIIQKTKK